MNDTIAALATAPGQGGIAIVRLSGPDSEQILSRVFRPAGKQFPLVSHMLTYGHLLDEAGERIDECMAVIMRAPRSYTREDVAELQLHGGVYVARRRWRCALRRERVLRRRASSRAVPSRTGALIFPRPRR